MLEKINGKIILSQKEWDEILEAIQQGKIVVMSEKSLAIHDLDLDLEEFTPLIQTLRDPEKQEELLKEVRSQQQCNVMLIGPSGASALVEKILKGLFPM